MLDNWVVLLTLVALFLWLCQVCLGVFSSVFLSRILFSPLGGTRFSVGHKGPATEGTFIFKFTEYLGAGFAYARFIFDCVIDWLSRQHHRALKQQMMWELKTNGSTSEHECLCLYVRKWMKGHDTFKRLRGCSRVPLLLLSSWKWNRSVYFAYTVRILWFWVESL